MDAELTARFDQLAALIEASAARSNERFEALEGRFERLEGRFEILEGRFERLEGRFDELEARFDASEARWKERFEAIEERWNQEFKDMAVRISRAFQTTEARWNERFDRLEHRVEAMDTKFAEKFISVDEQFRTLHLRIGQFEERLTGTVAKIHHDLQGVSSRVGLLEKRAGAIEEGLFQLSARVDVLADDMRLRFRVVNERLAGSAA